MFDWFVKTFSSAQQQATLFSIVVSTILAISLLLLNQWFSSKKSKSDLRISKLEELMSTLYAYERLCFDIIGQCYNAQATDNAVFSKMTKSVELADKIEMLAALYFPSISFTSSDTQELLLKIHVSCLVRAKNGSEVSEKEREQLFNQDTGKIKLLISNVKSNAKSEMQKYT